MMKRTVVILAVLAAVPGMALARPGNGKGMGPERSAFRHEQHRKVVDHRLQQKAENRTFRDSLKGMTDEEREAALRDHKAAQKAENSEFRAKLHEENMAFMKERLAANRKLTDAQKEELISFFEKQHQENVAFREKQYADRVAFFEKIADDATLTQKQKKQAIKDFMKGQRTEAKAYRSEQKQERRAEIGTLHEGTDDAGASTGTGTGEGTGSTGSTDTGTGDTGTAVDVTVTAQ